MMLGPWHTTQILHPRTGTRISYQKLESKFCTPDTHKTGTRNTASDALQDAGFSFQSYVNDELAVAPAIFMAIYVTRKTKENKRKRTLAGEKK